MNAIPSSQAAFRRGTASIFALLTPQQVRQLAALQADPSLSERIEELAQKANEGELSDSERAEYEGYIEANDLLMVLQSEARNRLTGEP